MTSSSGLSTSSRAEETATSNVRLTAKSIPSKTGGLSSKSGTDWPGTNSARWIRISIVDGAIRTTTPRWWQVSTSSTACCWGKAGSAMMTSSALCSETMSPICSSGPSERRPLSGRGVSEMKPMTWTGLCPPEACSAWATASICSPVPTRIARRL